MQAKIKIAFDRFNRILVAFLSFSVEVEYRLYCAYRFYMKFT